MIKNTVIYKVAFFCSLLAGFFTFTDLQISILLVNKQAGWADFLQRFGELPGLFLLYSATIIYLSEYHPAPEFKKIFVLVFLYSAAIYLSRFIFISIYSGLTGSYVFVDNNRWMIILVLAVFNLLIIFPFRRLKFSERTLRFSKVSILLGLFGYLLSVQPLKHLWGRVRFRDLDPLYSNFTPWFVPNFLSGGQSMPSGHSAMAWVLLPLLILIPAKNKKLRILLLLLIIAWGLTVCLSRIVIGAHYASDVLVGACIVIFIFYELSKEIYS